jgi:hypothetical protein
MKIIVKFVGQVSVVGQMEENPTEKEANHNFRR